MDTHRESTKETNRKIFWTRWVKSFKAVHGRKEGTVEPE